MANINYACEGTVDAAIAERLIRHAGGNVGLARPAFGKGKLDPLLGKYLNAARQNMKWLILRDLDRDADCGPTLRAQLLRSETPCLCFRVAIREAESWLLADRRSMADFLRVSEAAMPTSPDELSDPKQVLVNLARRSRKKDIQEAIVPHPSSGRPDGPEYVSWMAHFARSHWNVAIASQGSPSLARAVRRIQELVDFEEA